MMGRATDTHGGIGVASERRAWRCARRFSISARRGAVHPQRDGGSRGQRRLAEPSCAAPRRRRRPAEEQTGVGRGAEVGSSSGMGMPAVPCMPSHACYPPGRAPEAAPPPPTATA
eukprot:194960-Chlamydomonas_euryale.AAC.2